jgi:fatty-acid desaturase
MPLVDRIASGVVTAIPPIMVAIGMWCGWIGNLLQWQDIFGRRDYDTSDESRNLAWLAIPTWGEAWHNNHHAFPTSYRHGLRRWQIDPSAAIIRALEVTFLAWDVVRVDSMRLQRRALAQQV